MEVPFKARQDVEFYNLGNVQLGKTNITRDITVQPYFYFKIPDPGLKLLESVTVLTRRHRKVVSTVPRILTLFYPHCHL